MKNKSTFLLLTIFIFFISSCSAPEPKKEENTQEIAQKDAAIKEKTIDDWRLGDPTILKCEFPDPNIFFILTRRPGRGPILTENSVTIVENSPQHLQLILKNENGTFIEEIQQISTFNALEEVAYAIKTTETFGSYNDNSYQLIKADYENYWELNNILLEKPSTLLAAMEDVMLFESPRDTAIINLREKFYELTDNDEIYANLEKNWVNLSKIDDEWVIFDICRYGPDHLHIDYNDGWMEFSGGGDAYSKEIDTLILYDTHLEVGYRDVFHAEISDDLEKVTIAQFYFTENNVLIFKIGENETRYIAENAKSQVRTITEECDEEDY